MHNRVNEVSPPYVGKPEITDLTEIPRKFEIQKVFGHKFSNGIFHHYNNVTSTGTLA